jgi:putative ABC transport system permease protein
MFLNNLKIAIRNLLKNKTVSFINVFGLSIGITCTILILLWVQDEVNFDKFHKNGKQIYRVVQEDKDGKNSRTPALLAPEITAKIPEIVSFTRVFKLPGLIFKQETNIFNEGKGIVVDPQFFTIFDFPFIEGNPETALSAPSNVIITESLAKKYFGNSDPINKTINIDGKSASVVTGVIKDIPKNSHLKFDFVLPFCLWEAIMPSDVNNWGAFNYTTYLQLAPGADIAAANQKINQIAKDKLPSQLLAFWNKFELQPLSQTHLSADISNHHFLGNFTVVEDRNTVYIFSCIAFFILFLACINFMNLSIAQSGSRTLEIGLKKVMGSSKVQLRKQFMSEFFLISLIALTIAIIAVHLLLPWFNQISGKALIVNHAKNIIPYLIILLLTTLLGGFYPTFSLSSFNPAQTLKAQVHGPHKTSSLRSFLVIFQFAVSIILLAGTFIVNKQLQYIQDKKLGFQKENIVYAPITGNSASRYKTMKEELLKNPDILAVSAKDCLPTTTLRNLVDFYWDDKKPDQEVMMELTGVDYQYFEQLNIGLLAGRSFSEAFPGDASSAFVLNEEAVKQTGLESPIGKKFATWNKSGTIVGIIKNTNFKSLHEKPNPQVYHVMNNIQEEAGLTGVMLIKLNGMKQAEALSFFEKTWKNLNSDTPFEYHFLDQTYDQLYASERRINLIFSYFSILAILIACLGLLGLALYSADQRTKEIGIRKVNGAKISEVLVMLNKDFVKWVAIAFVIATPIAYYAMHKWLQNFAYKTELSWWIFALAGVLALGIALLTVSFQSWKAARRNPVEALRYE